MTRDDIERIYSAYGVRLSVADAQEIAEHCERYSLDHKHVNGWAYDAAREQRCDIAAAKRFDADH